MPLCDEVFRHRVGCPDIVNKHNFLRKREARAALILIDGTPCAVTMPAFGEIQPREISVLLQKPHTEGIYVECNANTLSYISAVCD